MEQMEYSSRDPENKELFNAREYGSVSAVTRKDTDLEEKQDAILKVDDVVSLKNKYGNIYQIDVIVGDDDVHDGDKFRFIFKKPNTASFNRYLKTASKNMATSTVDFVMDNIIDEQRTELEKQTDIYPGLALNIGQKLLNALGMGDNINFRKL